MHFHLPKPLHGWRAFAGEVGIIVVGVLIALGAEQVAEGWRWHERAEEGRERLKAEIGHEFLLMQEREAVGDCVDAQLNGLENSVLSSGTTLKPAVLYSENQPPGLIAQYVIRTPSRSWSDSAWQSIIAEGLPEHLTAREREFLPIHYSQLARISAANHDEDQVLGELRALSRPLPLDAGVRSGFVRMIEGERARNRFMANGSVQMIGTVEKLHYVPDEQQQRDWVARSGTVNFCRAHHLPLRDLKVHG
jgi:hypothetical protein